MPKARRSSYNLAFKLKIVAEAEAVENNSEIAREYGISESMVRRWRKDQVNLFNGELKMSAKRKTMGCYAPKYPELDQTLLEWFSEQRSQGKFFVFNQNQLIPVISIELLVWDSFRAHLTESVKADLQRRKFNVAVILGGLTPVLQLLDK